MPRNSRIRGRPSWVVGTKLDFLVQYSGDWQTATDGGLVSAGRFYTKVTKRFIKKYGWFFDRWADKNCPDPDPVTIDEDSTEDDLTDEEVTKRQEYFRAMRGVSTFSSMGRAHDLLASSSLWRGSTLTIRRSIPLLLSRSKNCLAI